MPAGVKAQTSKQAKASFKARGRPTISEQEVKQLRRSVELERRAERIREQQRRKNDTIKAKQEQARLEKLEKERLQMGSQRRTDRFGYLSSQMHLGAFLRINAKGTELESLPNIDAEDTDPDCEDFGDEGVDDEALISALENASKPTGLPKDCDTQSHRDTVNMPPPPIPTLRTPSRPLALPGLKGESKCSAFDNQDLDWLCNALESSTQVARELADPSHMTDSSSSESFDLSAEDVERLDQLGSMNTATATCSVALTPAMPLDAPKPNVPSNVSSRLSKRSPVRQQSSRLCMRGTFRSASSLMAPPPPLMPDPDFTMSQLESFVEDDVKLTQVVPG